MTMKNKKIVIITAKLMPYRVGFHDLLGRQEGLDTTLLYEEDQESIPRPNHSHFSTIQVKYWQARKLGITWHRLPIRHLWTDFDIYVFSGNPRILSTLLWATIFKLLGRKTVVWGHGHSPGAHPLTERLRLIWWQIFDHTLVYTDKEAEKLACQGYQKAKLTSLNNGLDQRAIDAAAATWTPNKLLTWQKQEGIASRVVLLSCARLLPKNNFEQMLACLPRLQSIVPNLLWCVIGDGPLKAKLQMDATKLGVTDAVRWLGAIYEEQMLAPWYLSSHLLIHPGAIGLTLLHAFGYGVPVITHDGVANHGPEISLLQPGHNGLVYEENNYDDLIEKVLLALEHTEERRRWGQAALWTVRNHYNIEIMARNFAKALATLG